MPKKYVLVSFALAFGLGVIAASTASAETVLRAYDSCRTVMSKPDENDSANRLVVRTEQGDPTRSLKCWIKFDVSGIDVQSLTSATLVTSLWKDRGSCELDVSYVHDDVVDNIGWTTQDLTWNNAPGNDPTSEGLLDSTKTTLLGRPRLIEGLAGDQFTVDALEALQTDTDGIVQFVLHNASAYLQIAHHYDPCEAWRPFLIVNEQPTDKARKPSPADGAEDVDRLSILSWTPGVFADKHDVYFSTSFDDVNDGVALVSPAQDANSYDPGLLEFGQTYFWRVDEVNAPPSSTIVRGDIWSFTVEPFGYPIENLTATASSATANKGMTPDKTVDGSGLTGDEHSTLDAAMWLTAPFTVLPAWIQYEFDDVYKLSELWVWNSNQSLESFVGFGAKDVTIEYSLDGAEWMKLTDTEFARAPGDVGYIANTTVDLTGVLAKFVRLTITSNWGGMMPQVGLSEVRFFYIPARAREPQPADDAAGVPIDVVLNWRPGREATSHKVYFDTEETVVTEGTAGAVTVTEPSYLPASLVLDTTYFWKVDEVGAESTWEGEVWSFSTAPYVIVDDFEGYTDNFEAGEAIWQAWVDGLEDPQKGGSQVGYNEAPFAERTIVHSGRQSMPLSYDGPSEATRTFESAQDWTRAGVTTLVLFFQGESTNVAGELYVKINGTEVPYSGDTSDLAAGEWKQANFPLPASAGLGSVRTLTIGVSSGQGMLYIDDIRLYRFAPAVTP